MSEPCQRTLVAMSGYQPRILRVFAATSVGTERALALGMRFIARHLTTVSFLALVLLATTGGCSAIGEAIDCDQMCNQLQVCVDGDLDVERCSDRCEDKADNNALRNKLDDCTDCLDQDYACAEVPEHCSSCKEVSEALL
jgi:hypothetical protein